MTRGQKKGRAAALKRTALYETWRWMLKRARHEGRLLRVLKLSDTLMPVDPMFRDFAKFALWARLSAGYDLEKDAGKFIARKDKRGLWEPDNCFFSENSQDNRIAELEAEITVGASSCSYKSKDSRGNLHGLSNTRLYDIWKSMCRRCTDKNQKDFPDYGGRGIVVCDAWKKDFIAFYDWAWEHGYSPCLSLDRTDVNGNYCPENCRWAGDLEQRLNQRKYNGRYSNVRLKVHRMRELLAMLPDNVVVTLVVRSDVLPEVLGPEDDYGPVPAEARLDARRRK